LALPAYCGGLELIAYTVAFLLLVFLSYLAFCPLFKGFKILLSFLIGGSLFFIGLFLCPLILGFIFNIPFWIALAIAIRLILSLKASREKREFPKRLIPMLIVISFYFASYYLYPRIFYFLSNFWLWLFLAIIACLILESPKQK